MIRCPSIFHCGNSSILAMLLRGSAVGFVLNISATILGFTTQLVLTRSMDVAQYGIFALVTAWLQVLVLPGRFGFDSTVLRFGAEYLATGQGALLRGLLRFGHCAVFGISGLLALVAVGGALILRDRLSGDLLWAFLLAMPLLPVMTVGSVRQAFLLGHKLIVPSQVSEAAFRPALFLSMVAAFGFLGAESLRAPFVVVLMGVSFVMSLLLISWWYRRLLSGTILATEPVYRRAEWLDYSWPMMLLIALTVLIKQVNVMVLGAMRGADEAGLYAVAWQVAEFTAFGMNAVNIIAAPMIASLHAERRHADLQQLLSRGMAGGLVFALLVGTAILLAGRPLLGVFGPAFGRALPALRILVAGQVLSAACGPVWYLLTMTGHQVAATKAMALSACATVLMAVLLIPTRGLTGAALAGAGGTLLWSCLLYGIAICRLGVDPGVAGLVRWRQSDSFGAGRDERVP